MDSRPAGGEEYHTKCSLNSGQGGRRRGKGGGKGGTGRGEAGGAAGAAAEGGGVGHGGGLGGGGGGQGGGAAGEGGGGCLTDPAGLLGVEDEWVPPEVGAAAQGTRAVHHAGVSVFFIFFVFSTSVNISLHKPNER